MNEAASLEQQLVRKITWLKTFGSLKISINLASIFILFYERLKKSVASNTQTPKQTTIITPCAHALSVNKVTVDFDMCIHTSLVYAQATMLHAKEQEGLRCDVTHVIKT